MPNMSGRRDLLVFDISGKFCALPVEDLLEIVPMASLSRPPSMPTIMEGFLNLRGTAVPVVSLSRMFRLQERPLELHTPIIVVRGRRCPLAFLVDHVTQILSLSVENAVPLQRDHSFNDCAEAQVATTEHVVHILSPERLLIEKERQCLSEFQAMEQRRLNELQVTLP
jgi:purine-binding chemotaxis protein CheW